MKLKCEHCGHELETPKNKVRCPKCKKHALMPVLSNSVDSVPAILSPGADYIVQTKNKSDRTKYDDDGKSIGTYTKTEQIGQFNNQFENLTGIAELHRDDTKLFDKKVRFRVSPRTRPEIRRKRVNCSGECGREFQVLATDAPTGYYICTKCARRRIGQ